ncbi:MAG: hypothetical protein R3296_11805 [Oleiphilaceae bacterium]|nr:hypothetical protein [Oleiphilaceae bacterium]
MGDGAKKGAIWGFSLLTGSCLLALPALTIPGIEASYHQCSREEVKLQAEDGSTRRVRVPSHNLQLGLRLLF